MDKVYAQSKDLHVKASKIYKKANDAYAYQNSGKTEKIDSAILQDLCLKGLIVIDGNNVYIPTGCVTAADVTTITYVTADTSSASTAVLATLRSK